MRHVKNAIFSAFLMILWLSNSVFAYAEPVGEQPQVVGQALQTTASSTASTLPEPAEVVTPIDPFPSGLLEITDYKYPVFLYAPRHYRPDSAYALIVIAPREGAEAQEGVKYLKSLADRKSIFVLSPHGLWPRSGYTPYHLDEWFLQVKRDVVNRFPIDKKRIYIIGKDSGANYAAYLSMKYPEEFKGAALIGEAWVGPYTQIMEVNSTPIGQIPFFVAFTAEQTKAREENQIWFDNLQAEGYPLRLVEVKSKEDFLSLEFKKDMYDWLEETGQNWAATVAISQKTFKAKFKKAVRNFFLL